MARKRHSARSPSNGRKTMRTCKKEVVSHREWGDHFNKIRKELAWTIEQTALHVDLSTGWVKRAISGQSLIGSLRTSAEEILRDEWKRKFPDRPFLEFPYWMPWSETEISNDFENTSKFDQAILQQEEGLVDISPYSTRTDAVSVNCENKVHPLVEALNIPLTNDFRTDPLLLRSLDLEKTIVIGHVIEIASYHKYKGITGAEILVSIEGKAIQYLSPTVRDLVSESRANLVSIGKKAAKESREKQAVFERDQCETKLHLKPPHGLGGFILDSGNAHIHLCRNDWFTWLAMKQFTNDIKRDVAKNGLDSFPNRLDVVLGILSASQDKILMGLRSRDSECLESEVGVWALPGEQMILEEKNGMLVDADPAGIPMPEKTVRRALHEPDETGFPGKWANDPNVTVRFVAAATEWNYLMTNLFAVVSLAEYMSEERCNNFLPKKGEHVMWDWFPLNVESIVDLICRGTYEKFGVVNSKAPLADFARYGLLVAAFNKFGYEAVSEYILRRGENKQFGLKPSSSL